MNINNLLFFTIIILLIVLSVVIFAFLCKIRALNLKFLNYIKLATNTINSVRYGNLAARLILNNDKKYPSLSDSINRMIETIQDREKMISEFKKEITSHNIFLESLINSLSDGFLICDENFVIKKMTQVAQNLFGKSAEGKKINDFVNFEPNDMLNCDKLSFETVLKSNTDVYLSVTVSNLNFSDNPSFKYLITIKDISNEQELVRVKNDFIATLAHDLRVPLIAETNTLNLLKDGKFGELNSQTNEVVDLLLQSNKDVVLLTDVLLETYKLEQTKLVLNKQKVNINNLIKDVCNELFGVITANSFKINFNFCNDFDALVDSFQFKRVLRNIINNSIDYSQQYSDKIDIYTSNSDKGFVVTVRDYGAGIPKDEQEKIFQKFYSGAHKFRKVGSGLGLYLANEIVKAHDGNININSNPNKNTDFEIFIPL